MMYDSAVFLIKPDISGSARPDFSASRRVRRVDKGKQQRERPPNPNISDLPKNIITK